MTAIAADRIESAAQAYSVVAQLASEFAAGAAARDLGRELPFAEVDRLAAGGLLAITAPAAFGGADLPPSVVAEVVRVLAAADPNIAQIPHSHSFVAPASLALTTAKILADRAANEVSAALFEVGGTRSAAADLNLHQYWRNVRMHTLHDPVWWKYQHIGRALLHDIAPPPHGVI
ncbi:acyl-CoA dehydrogenase family protein [Nocardia sp. NPDC004278]